MLVIVLDYLFRPRFRLHASFEALLPWGIALIVVGFVVLGASAAQMLRAFKRHELATTGLCAVAPNPMFIAYVLFILPGLSLLLRSWLVLTSSIVFYVLIKIMSRPEEEWLKQEFGERYTEYRRRVLLKFLSTPEPFSSLPARGGRIRRTACGSLGGFVHRPSFHSPRLSGHSSLRASFSVSGQASIPPCQRSSTDQSLPRRTAYLGSSRMRRTWSARGGSLFCTTSQTMSMSMPK